jgi:hypothetical protein
MLHCVFIPHFLYQFICWWIFQLILSPHCYSIMFQWIWVWKYFFKILVWILLDIHLVVGLLDPMVILLLNFWKISVFHSHCTILHSCQQYTREGSTFSISSPTLAISCSFDCSHPNGCEVISHGSDFHQSYD